MLSHYVFSSSFNPDVFSPGVRHAHTDEAYKKQCGLIRDAADFLLTVQIPAFIRDCLDHTSVPMDGHTLSDNLHNRGINIRYIGIIANMIGKVPQLSYINSILVSEVLTRSAKHLFTSYMLGLDMTCLASAVSHFFNCFFTSHTQPKTAGAPADLLSRSAASRRRNRKQQPKGSKQEEWTSLTSKSLWKALNEEMLSYFHFEMNLDNVDAIANVYRVQKTSLLRSLCHKTGVQLRMREYFSDNSKLFFAEEDVLNLFPRSKHINPRASDAYNFYTTGQSKIQQGYLKDGYELISEALNLLNNVYGAMHPEIAQCLRMLARLNYIMGDHAEALSFQQKAVLMSERVNGIDHPYTVTEYVHLALYCFANSQVLLCPHPRVVRVRACIHDGM